MKLLKISLLILILFLTSCNDWDFFNGYDNRFKITNNSTSDVYYILGYNYPDTTIDLKDKPYLTDKKIAPGETNTHHTTNRWERLIKSLPKDTLMVFILNADTVERTSWEEIRDKYKILKRYDLSQEDLSKSDWKTKYE